MRQLRRCSSLILGVSAIVALAQSSGFGTVNMAHGEGVSGVWVQELGSWRGELTKADGAFHFPRGRATTLLFVKDGLQPQVRQVTGGEGELNLVMQPTSGSSISLGTCEQQSRAQLPEIELARNHGIRIRRGGDVDFVAYAATYTAKGASAVLTSMTGIHVAGLTPEPGWVVGLSQFTVGSITCGGVQWIDLRGTSGSGLESRWIGYGLSHLAYSKVPTEAAHAFDRAIERGCCPVSRLP